MTRLKVKQPLTGLSRGYSLIELMVAITIGFVLIAAVISTFIWSVRNYDQDDSTSRQQENARFALDAISDDLRMSGFLYDILDPNAIDTSAVASMLDGEDCGATGVEWAFDTSNLVEVLHAATPTAVETAYNCIDADNVHSLATIGTDVLAIKRVKTPRETDVTGRIHLQAATDGQSRLIAWNTSTAPVNATFDGATNWEYLTNIYYISTDTPDNYPTLFRKTLQGTNTDGGGNTLTIEDDSNGIAEGIEYFHINWGIDHEMIDGLESTPPDGQPNYYVTSPTTAQLPGVVTAQIHVLVRSPNYDIDYVDEKTYSLGGLTVPSAGTFGDNYRRKVFTTTVKLRNRVIKNTALNLINNF